MKPNFNAELRQMSRTRCSGGPGHNQQAAKLWCSMCIQDYAQQCYETGVADGVKSEDDESDTTQPPSIFDTPVEVEEGGSKVSVSVRLVPEEHVPVKKGRVIGERKQKGKLVEGDWTGGSEFVKDLKKPAVKDEIAKGVEEAGGFVDE